MGKPAECAELIRQSYSPLHIADKLGVNHSTVVDYLYRAIGHNLITMSDIVFTWPEPSRIIIENIINRLNTDYWYSIYNDVDFQKTFFDRNNLQFYLELRKFYVGDLYFMISNLEIYLHNFVKDELSRHYNQYENEWWEKGVSGDLKNKCELKKSKNSPNSLHSYHFLNFMQLSDVIVNNWSLFRKIFTNDLIKYSENFRKYLFEVNKIRNKVMHPLNSGIIRCDNEFKIVKQVYNIMIESNKEK